MNTHKKEIIKSFIPKAVLNPITEHAKRSFYEDHNIIPIKYFPFKIGRESRVGKSNRGFFVKLRISNSDSQPNNDVYLIDENEYLQLSKEHCEITLENDKYIIVDRNSTNGVIVNDEKIDLKLELSDGDIIKLGTEESKFVFEFLTLDI